MLYHSINRLQTYLDPFKGIQVKQFDDSQALLSQKLKSQKHNLRA